MPRLGSRAASVTLGHPNKPFWSAKTARAPRARELVAQGGGLTASGRATRGPRLDDRSVHDSPQIRIKTAPSGLESISGCRVPYCEAQNGAPPPGTEPCYGRFGVGLRNGVLAFQPP